MDTNVEKLKNLNRDIKGILADFEKLKAENVKMKNLLQQSEVEKQQFIEQHARLSEQLKTTKLAQALTDIPENDSRHLKNQINTYLREIDKCLILLNSD